MIPFISSYESRLANCERGKRLDFREARRLAHVEAVELGNPVLGDELRDGRIALGEPSEELGNTAQLVSTWSRVDQQDTHPMLATTSCVVRSYFRGIVRPKVL
jgi:hypothetical protein